MKSEENILIVDDNLENLKILSATLSEQGYMVQSVTSGLMALTVAQLAPPDLILLENIKEIFQIKLERKVIQFNIIVASNLPQYIYSDAKKLYSCLSNLVGNAIKFVCQGSITLRVSFVDEAGTYRLVFQVEDTGCGISASELDKLFDAFTQADAGRKSLQETGLGLAITRKFVRMMKGEIQVTSTLGKGSIFTFYIELDVTKNNPATIQFGTYDTIVNFNSKTPEKISDNSLLKELTTMPKTWLLNLHQAANEVDEELLESLIKEVPKKQAFLSESSSGLVNNFRLDLIIQFVQQILNEGVGSRE